MQNTPSASIKPVSSSSSSPPNWFRGFIQGRTRIYLAWVFAILLGLSARQYPTWPGVVICFIGASLRFWASGFLRKDSRPAVGGPYAHVRNPLYLGTYLMAVGTAWAVEAYWLLAIISVLFAIIYHYIILDEEVKLHRIFGEPYLKYSGVVPRFIPRIFPAPKEVLVEVNPEISHHNHSWALSRQNKSIDAYASFFGLIGGVSVVAWIWQAFY